jgi:hypothetical protein
MPRCSSSTPTASPSNLRSVLTALAITALVLAATITPARGPAGQIGDPGQPGGPGGPFDPFDYVSRAKFDRMVRGCPSRPISPRGSSRRISRH